MSLPPIRQYLDALNQHRLQIAPALRKHLNGREKWLKALSDSAKTNIPKEHAKAKATGKTKVKAKANAKAKANTPTMIGIPQDVRHMCDEFESDSNRLHAQAKAATGSLPTNLGSAWLTKLDLAQEAHRKLLNDSVTAADNWTLMQVDAAGEHYDLIDAALRELNALEEGKEPGVETRSNGAGAESKAPKTPPSDPAHSEDFTSVNWYGTKFFFKKGLEAESVRLDGEALKKRA